MSAAVSRSKASGRKKTFTPISTMSLSICPPARAGSSKGPCRRSSQYGASIFSATTTKSAASLWLLKVSGLKPARVSLMGVKRSAAQGVIGKLLPFLLIDAVRKEAAHMGFTHVELSWILEDNMPTRHINESLGGIAYKTYRIYEKSL